MLKKTINSDTNTIIFDLDGVVWKLDELVPKAKETIHVLRENGNRIIFLTNNSSMSRIQILKKLNRFGIAASVDEIISSTYTTALYISRFNPTAKVFAVGSQGLKDEMLSKNLSVVENPRDAEFLVAGFDRNLSYKKLEEALIAHLNGARFIATNDDGMLPTETGFRPGAGAVIGAICGIIKKRPEVVVGKPNVRILKKVFKIMDIELKRSFIIGDSLETDVLLAQNLGIPSMLVLTGNTRSREEATKSKYIPNYIVDSIADVPKLLLEFATFPV